MKGRILGAIAVCISLVAPATAYTIRDAMADAYRNSDLLEQNRYLLRLQDEGVAQQISGLRPILSLQAVSSFSAPTDTYVTSLNLVADMLLYDGGGSDLLVQAARAQVNAARQGLIELEQQVLLNAVQAYMNCWRDLQIVQVRESNVRVVTQQVRAARERFELGEDTRTDVAQAEASLAIAQAALANARGQLEISEELFILAVGRRPVQLSGPGGMPAIPASEAEADALARQLHPVIRQLQYTVEADELALAAARTDYGPTISLRATTGETRGGLNEGSATQLQLQLNQPIYRGGQLFSLERVALATLSASRAQLNQQVRSTVQTVGNSYTQVRIAEARITASIEESRAAQLAFEGVREEAELGARTTLDVLDAEQDFLNARIGRIEAQTDRYVGRFSVLVALGMLTADYLELPVEQYDPDDYSDAFSTAPARVTSEQGSRLDTLLQRIGRD